MDSKRRTLMQWAALSGLAGLTPGFAQAQASEHVVVVGGGFAGASVAKYLALWGEGLVSVTLIDPRPAHTVCVLSNLVLTGQLDLADLTFPLSQLADRYGVQTEQGEVAGIDQAARQVVLEDGRRIGFDRLVMAAGISFQEIPGLDAQRMPHAWIAGESTLLLKDQLAGLTAGATVIMTIPGAPFRCPPGPYERACLLASEVQRAGGGRVIVLDANDDIQAEKETFARAFSELYGDTLEYHTQVSVESADAESLTLFTSAGEIAGDVVNVIPTQQAASVVRDSGLASGRWAPVDPVTYESTLDGFDGIYVLGDSQGTGQPKSAHMASSQAKVCADAILRSVQGLPTHSETRLANITTNSACYSPVTRSEASWLTANFALDPAAGQMRLTQIGAAEGWNSENYEDMFTWAENLFADTFG